MKFVKFAIAISLVSLLTGCVSFANGFHQGVTGRASSQDIIEDNSAISSDVSSYSESVSSVLSDRVQESSEDNAETIILRDGEVGEYGKEIDIDGETYIWYVLSPGTYQVQWSNESTAKGGTLYVQSDVLEKTADGYSSYEILCEADFMDGSILKAEEINIQENEHVMITVNSVFEIIKKE